MCTIYMHATLKAGQLGPGDKVQTVDWTTGLTFDVAMLVYSTNLNKELKGLLLANNIILGGTVIISINISNSRLKSLENFLC